MQLSWLRIQIVMFGLNYLFDLKNIYICVYTHKYIFLQNLKIILEVSM